MSHERIHLVVGDITKLAMDAVVTAANESLMGGGGVDGAIHRAAGPALLDECRTIGICPEGEARITRGYLLPAKHIIHTVGPVWEGGGYDEAGTLRKAYESTLALAEKHDIGSLAIPCIATGNYGFPTAQACEIAVDAVSTWLTEHELPREVTFCCFLESDAELYRRRLSATRN